MEIMWKLTITQKRMSKHIDGMITENVEFESGSIDELTMLVIRLTATQTTAETTYKIEKAGAKDE